MSSAFSISWLQMREPFDHAARGAALVERWASALPQDPVILDLGCGLGSNLRFTAQHLPGPSRWVLVDHDQALLDAQPAPPPGVTLERCCLDLDDPGVPWPEADAITTQALLDLVGESWLERLVEHLVRHRLPLLAALTVDGRVSFHPSHADDDLVMRLFRSHQLTDRGFGASLGPRAASWLAGRLAGCGFTVELAEADWQIQGAERPMLQEMVAGIAGAAAEMAEDAVMARLQAWKAQRLQRTEHLVVGHLDLLALPPPR